MNLESIDGDKIETNVVRSTTAATSNINANTVFMTPEIKQHRIAPLTDLQGSSIQQATQLIQPFNALDTPQSTNTALQVPESPTQQLNNTPTNVRRKKKRTKINEKVVMQRRLAIDTVYVPEDFGIVADVPDDDPNIFKIKEGKSIIGEKYLKKKHKVEVLPSDNPIEFATKKWSKNKKEVNKKVQQGGTHHTQHIDIADKADFVSDIDFLENDLADYNTAEERKTQINLLMEKQKNLSNRFQQHSLRYPKAVFISKKVNRLADLQTSNKLVHKIGEFKAKFSERKAVSDLLRSDKHISKQVVKRTEALANVFRNMRNEEKDEQVAKALCKEDEELIDLCAVKVTNSYNLEDARRMITERGFFIPKNATAKSISFIARGAVEVLKNPQFGMVHGTFNIRTLEATALLLGYSSFDDWVDALESAFSFKNFTDVNQILKSDIQDNDYRNRFAIEELEKAIQTRDLKEELMENDLEDNYSIESDGTWDSVDINLEDARQKNKIIDDIIEKRSNRFFKALKYSSRTTYKFVFYLMLQSGVILPFGRTLPNIAWSYLALSHLDPRNEFGLKYNAEEYILKIGGTGLLEKSIFFKNTTDMVFRRCYSPSSNQGSNTGEFSGIMNACYTALARMQAKRKMYFEYNDFAIDEEEELKALILKFNTDLERNSLQDSAEFRKDRMDVSNLIDIMQNSKNDSSKQMIASMFGITIPEKMMTTNEVLTPISYKVIHMAETIMYYLQRASDGDKSSSEWFLLCHINLLRGRIDSFATIYDLVFQQSKFENILKMLFGDMKTVKKVRAMFEKSEQIVSSNDTLQLAELLEKISGDASKVYLEWTSVVSKEVINSNKEAASLIHQALQEEICREEARLSCQPFTIKDKRIQLQALVTGGNVIRKGIFW